MNFTDLVSYVTTKTQLVTADDIAACKMFVSKRYELIWNSALWKDALIMVSVPFDPMNNQDNKDGIVLLPEVVNRVVALRTQTQSVKINGLEYFYRIDWDAFNAGTTNVYGAAAEFAIISPVWFIWRGASGLQVSYDNTAGDTKFVQITWRDETGKQSVSTVGNGFQLLSTQPYQITISGAGSTDVNGTYQWDGLRFNLITTETPPPIYYIIFNKDTGQWELTEVSGTATQVLYSLATDAVAGQWVTVNGDGPAPISAYVNNARLEIESMFKPTTLGNINLNPISIGGAAGGTLQTNDTQSPSFQRIRLFSIPTDTMTLNVLGKRPFVPLNYDQQIPQLRNIDNVLIAFSCADMLKRARQYAKAAEELTEGVALLKELSSLEVLQAANHQQFIPTNGYGDSYFSPNNDGGWYGFGY